MYFYVIIIISRVADPHSFHPDPDPAFEAEYRSASRSNPDPGINDRKLKRLQLKNFFIFLLDQKLQFTYP
jgi:hypothetical protein